MWSEVVWVRYAVHSESLLEEWVQGCLGVSTFGEVMVESLRLGMMSSLWEQRWRIWRMLPKTRPFSMPFGCMEYGGTCRYRFSFFLKQCGVDSVVD